MTAPKKAAASTTKKAAASTSTDDTAEKPAKRGIGVGQVVAHSYHDIPSGSWVQQAGIVVALTDDGAVVAPLAEPAVVPLAELQAL
jgi:hypothetical protein